MRFDEIEGAPGRAGVGAKCRSGNRGGVAEGGLEVSLAERGEAADVGSESGDPTRGAAQASMFRAMSVAAPESPRAADSRAAVSLPGHASR
jgi:hypothetical protein